jgi:uncharacterized protein YdaT
MPWTSNDATTHNKKLTSPMKKKVWSQVANQVLAKTGDDGRAIREANFAANRAKKKRKLGPLYG